LHYTCSKGSLEKTVKWARDGGWAKLTPAALLFRLRDSQEFLSRTLAAMIECPASCSRKLKIVDATFLAGPGAKTSSFTLHVQYSPASGLPIGVEIVDGHGGETFTRHTFSAGDLVIGDRGYSQARGIDYVLMQGGDVLVRLIPRNVPLYDAQGTRLDWEAAACTLPEVGLLELELTMPAPGTDRQWPVRVVCARGKDGKVFWLLSSVPKKEMVGAELMELYRLRWQIELFFKRLKSLMDIDELPTRESSTARPWILAKLIAAVLVLKLTDENFSPWGYDPRALAQPLEAVLRWAGSADLRDPGTSPDPRRTKQEAA
jgi:hypothetical protein